MYLIKQLMDGRSGGGQQRSGEGGGAASPGTGESPHGGAGSGREYQQRQSLSAEGGGTVDVKALLALDDQQRGRLLSLLVQLETQTLALQARDWLALGSLCFGGLRCDGWQHHRYWHGLSSSSID